MADRLGYLRSFQFGAECLGQHAGSHQILDLGDGNGPSTSSYLLQPTTFLIPRCHFPENETAVIRYDYGDPALGTCQESIQGGSHFRYWVQNGPQRNSSAVFMAFSYEDSLQRAFCLRSNLVDQDVKCVLMLCPTRGPPNFPQWVQFRPVSQFPSLSYFLRPCTVTSSYSKITISVGNRDLAVANVTNQTHPINSSTLTNTSVFQGQTASNGYTYSTTVTYVSGLLKNTSDGVNHAGDVALPGSPAIDGLVSVFEAHIVEKPKTAGASS